MVKGNDIALIIVNNGARELTRDLWVGTVDEMSRDGVPTLSTVLGKRVLQELIDKLVNPGKYILVMCLLYSNAVRSSGTFQPTITPASQQNGK